MIAAILLILLTVFFKFSTTTISGQRPSAENNTIKESKGQGSEEGTQNISLPSENEIDNPIIPEWPEKEAKIPDDTIQDINFTYLKTKGEDQSLTKI